jgi:hypothetical protein
MIQKLGFTTYLAVGGPQFVTSLTNYEVMKGEGEGVIAYDYTTHLSNIKNP